MINMPRKGLNISKCHKGKYEYWRGRYEKGIDRNGRMTYGEIYAKTYEEVEERLVKVQNEINANTFIEPTKITVAQWLDRWLKTYKDTSLTQSTYISYKGIIENHITPAIGGLRLQILSLDMLQDFFNKKAAEINPRTKKPLSVKTLKNIKTMLVTAFKQAIISDIIKRYNNEFRGRRKAMDRFVSLEGVKKIYNMGEVKIMAAAGIDFQIKKGEFAVVVGPSGAGKTTVLNILGGMDTATDGKVLVDGQDIATYSQKQLTAYRRDDIGFVFQFYNLIPNLTALENVELALQICKDPMDAADVLEEVGLGERLNNFPAQLSGGEQQRVSIARALAKNPKLLLCDEPTGALDYNTGKAILKLLQDTCRNKGMTVILITHNSAIAPMADRVIKIKNGKVSDIIENKYPVSVETIEW